MSTSADITRRIEDLPCWRCEDPRGADLRHALTQAGEVSDSERLRTRRAYYSGAQFLFATMHKLSAEADGDCVSLDAIGAELTAFLVDVRAGKA